MTPDIQIRGAAQNYLRHLDLDLPSGKIIALMGPSGSGKSTLAFETLFAESRRRFLDCLAPRARQLLAQPEKPAFDSITGLPPALCLEQNIHAGYTRTLLGTLTETLDYLRILYAAIGVPHDPDTGAQLTKLSPDEISGQLDALPEGTRLTLLAPLPPGFGSDLESDILDFRKQGYLRIRLRGEILDLEDIAPGTDTANAELVIDRIVVRPGILSRLADSLQTALRISPDEVRAIVQEPGSAEETRTYYTRYRNNETGFTLPDLSPKSFSYHSPAGACPECQGSGTIQQNGKETLCPACGGYRLNATARAVTIDFAARILNLPAFCALTIDDNIALLPQAAIPEALAAPARQIIDELSKRLHCLQSLGLGYLSLARPVSTLSGGEIQRARLAGQLGGGLSGVLYILDEPTIGLHPQDTEKLISALQQLRDKGNTILVVEHDPQLLAIADHIVEMGPGSGPEGGAILAQGSYAHILQDPSSPSGAWLSGRKTLPAGQPLDLASCTWATLRDAHAHNLRHIDFTFPLGALCCLSGPSGSGKSTLIEDCLIPAIREGNLENGSTITRTIVIDQQPLGLSPRSTPATATGLLDVLRPLYASLPLSKQRGYTAARFSTNTRGGRCERCGGTGRLEVDMHFLADVYAECDACHGQRYNRETLEVTWRGKSIAQILALSVAEALEFFRPIPAARNILQCLHDIGLGYLTLDRPATTLSGGEAQRIKLATHLAKASPKSGKRLGTGEHILFILDEPSTGLHFHETALLLQALHSLRQAGHSILCIEHHTGILKAADYLIDLGPGAGADGGTIVAQGTPAELIARGEQGIAAWLGSMPES